MTDISETLGNAATNSTAQQRGALAALAQGGSAGLKAYNDAITQAGSLKQAALGQAAKRSALIGGPEAAPGNYTAPISAAADTAISGLNTNKGALSNYFNEMGAANKDYFAKVSAAVPVQELALLRAQQNKGSNMTESEREAQIIGTAQGDVQSQSDAIAKSLATERGDQDRLNSQIKAQEQSVKSAYADWAKASKAKAKGGSPETATNLLKAASEKEKQLNALKNELAGLDTKYNDPGHAAAPSLSESAIKSAQNYGYTPEQAKVLYGEGGSKITPYQSTQIKNATAAEGQKLSAWANGASIPDAVLGAAGIKATKGYLAQEDLPTLLDATDLAPEEKQYLIATYGGKFKTRKQLNKAH